MKLARPVPKWEQVASHVRKLILDGSYPPGQPLPSEEALAAEFGVSRPTIREGIKTLVAEGLVEVSRPRGTIVRDPYGRPTRTERHTSASVSDDAEWTDTGEPDYYRINATADQADLLGISPGEPLLVRSVKQQSAGLHRMNCLFLPFSVAERTPWADNPHLPTPGKLYEHFAREYSTLSWTEHVRARMPIGDETTSLAVPLGVPLLLVLRVTHVGADPLPAPAPLALEEIRHRADQAELAYTIPRTQ